MPTIQLTLTNSVTDYDLFFDVLDIDIAHRWLKEVQIFIDHGQPWDDSQRFYNFPNTVWNQESTAKKIRQLCVSVNAHSRGLIAVPDSSCISQDELNYLHNIFERYHGLYDQQTSNEFYSNAPLEVQQALGDLNIWIHRYESLGGIPRFVMTWRDKPGRQPIQDTDFGHFSLAEEWGDLRLNYCEIGKPLYDLWHDNDRYISHDAFKPQHWFAFDFTVRFATESKEHFDQVENQIWQYFDQNAEMFLNLGYKKHDPRLALGAITVAKLRQHQSRDVIMQMIDQHQTVKSISIA
jgi:hypothetical protein